MNRAPVAVTETHISVLFFVGDRVYKLKKAVRFPFVDLSSREARERICHREVELNRRLAPDVYLGVLDVVGEDGRPVDHLVEMRRLDDDHRLAARVRGGRDVDTCLRALARRLAAFHAQAPTSPEISAAGSWEAVRTNWLDNLTEMEPFLESVLDADVFARIRTAADRYLAGRKVLFAERVDRGHIRDGHGDLLAEDIFCMDDGPRVLDCIEFNDRFRYGDVVADVAFLAMDLEALGAPDAAERFLSWYREFSAETYPQSLADHYIAYRAIVRSKVACLKYAQGDDTQTEPAATLLELADRHLDRARTRLILIGGLPGTGKSTLSSGLADATGWTVLNSDEVRKDLTGIAHGAHTQADFGEGIYSDEATAATYAELVARARTLLARGESVILDASWRRARDRDAAARVAETTSTDLLALCCVLEPRLAAEWMRVRATEGRDVSDADAHIAARMATRSDPWPTAIAIATGGTREHVVEAALEVLRTEASTDPQRDG